MTNSVDQTETEEIKESQVYPKYEREAYFNSNDETNVWSGYVLRQKVNTKLRRAGFEPVHIDKSSGAHYYENIPFECISFRKISKREYTEEQKQAMSERAKRNLRRSKD